MTYLVLALALMAAGSFGMSIGYYIATSFAKTGDDYFRRSVCALGHCGWGIIYLAVLAVILIINAVISL